MRKKYIGQDQFINAVMLGVEKWLKTDITDYDNYIGIKDMARFMWYSLDGRVYGQRWLKLLKPEKIVERIEEETSKRIDAQFKRLFGNIYIRR